VAFFNRVSNAWAKGILQTKDTTHGQAQLNVLLVFSRFKVVVILFHLLPLLLSVVTVRDKQSS